MTDSNASTSQLEAELEPIAVIGMACRLPGTIHSPSALWELVTTKGATYGPVPESRFTHSSFYYPASTLRLGSLPMPGGHFLTGNLNSFDAPFFHIPPIEANSMDPQQRMLLEVTWECLESAGVPPENLKGKNVGVYIGAWTSDYENIQKTNVISEGKGALEAIWVTGTGRAIISNRVSYIYDFKGPSMTIDTGCSATGIALHVACQQLRDPRAQAHSALVGGTNLMITPEFFMAMGALGVMSTTGPSKSFDERADGYGRAEAINCIYLKRLSDALRDGDPIRALIRSSAANSDGKTMGIASPSAEAQEAAIRQAYAAAGILDFNETAYVECHGTGTRAGDPMEARSVGKVFGGTRRANDPLHIGSTKPNMGHSEAASALTSIMKAVLAVEAEKIPPNIEFVKPSPAIQFDAWKIKVPTELTPWPENKLVKRVSVNSYGYGGSNVHIICDDVDSYLRSHAGLLGGRSLSQIKRKGFLVQHGPSEAVTDQANISLNRPYLLLFSAKSDACLKSYIKQLATSLRGKNFPQNLLPDLAYTLGVRRSVLSVKTYGVFSASTTPAFVDRLVEFADDVQCYQEVPERKQKTIGFIFTGQGAQWARMGVELWSAFPITLRTLERLDKALKALPDPPEWSLREELEQADGSTRINDAQFSQVLCTALQICLVNLLRAWNVRPSAVAGHSSGEIAAAYAAGLITASQAMIIAYYRGRVCSQAASEREGAMMAVGMGKENILSRLDGYEGKVGIACVNSPKSVTLSGDADCIKQLQNELAKDGAFVRTLRVPVAYHSHHMKPIGAQYLDLLERTGNFVPGEPDSHCPMFSSVTGEVLDGQRLAADYWRRNLESPVLFCDTVQRMVTALNADILIELGPHSALSAPIRDIRDAMGMKPERLEYLPTILRGQCSVNAVLDTMGRLYGLGYVGLNFEAINGVEKEIVSGVEVQPTTDESEVIPQYETRNVLVDLPAYAWDHSQKYWLEGQRTKEWRFRKNRRHDLIGSRIPGNDSSEPQWMNVLSVANAPWLKHHKVLNNIVVPATAYICMAIEALTQHLESLGKFKPEEAFLLRRITIQKPLILEAFAGISTLSAIRGTTLFLTLKRKRLNCLDESKWFEFSIRTMDEQATGMVTHCNGLICTIARKGGRKRPDILSNTKTQETLRFIPKDALYEALAGIGLNYGETFTGLNNVRSRMGVCEMIGEANIFGGAEPVGIDGVNPAEPSLQMGESTEAVSLKALDASAEDVASPARSDKTGGTTPVLDSPESSITAPDSQSEKPGGDVSMVEGGHSMHGGVTDMPELLRRLEEEDAKHIDSRYVVHPINLDHLLQLSYVTLYGGRLSFIQELMIPMFIQEVYVAAPSAGTVKLDLLSKVELSKALLTPKHFFAAAYDADGHIAAYFKNVHAMSSMLRNRTRKGEADIMRLEWTLCADMIRKYPQEERETVGPLPTTVQKVLLFLNLVATEVSHITKGMEPVDSHLSNQWINYVHHVLSPDIQQQLRTTCQGYIDVNVMTSEERQTEIERIAPDLIQHVRAHMIYLIYKNILPLFRGEEDPFQLFMNNGNCWQRMMMGEVVNAEGVNGPPESSQLSNIISPLVNALPGAKILEIGGGVGGSTRGFLDSWTEKNSLGSVVRRYESYTFTDISIALVSQARSQFQDNSRMRFQALDITKDPVEQGFEQRGYDVVFASNVLHLTEDISIAFANITKLLRPNGKLFLIELQGGFIGALDYPFILGSLRSFWVAAKEQNRQDTPLLSKDEWAVALEAAGFRNDVISYDRIAQGEGVLICATYMGAVTNILPPIPFPAPIVILYQDTIDTTGEQLKSALQSAFTLPVIYLSFDSDPFEIPDSTFVVSLVEVKSSLIYGISASNYAKLRYLLTSTSPILWVTSGAQIAARNPKGALINGLARTARNENPNLQIYLLDLSTEGLEEMTRHITRTLQYLMEPFQDIARSPRSTGEERFLSDWEFCEHGGQVFVLRLAVDYGTMDKYLPLSECQRSKMEPYRQEKDLRLVCAQRGMASSLIFEKFKLRPELPPDYIEIAPEYFGLNFKDVATVLGLLAAKTLGVECYGTVTKVGSAVAEIQPGDMVYSIGPNNFGNRIQTFSGQCRKIPSGVDPMAFTGSTVVYLTVIRALKEVAQLQEGERVLIHCAAGGVGIAAIHYAKLVGAEIYATCGNEAKRSFLTETHGIPPDRIFSSRDVSFGEGVMEATDQEGVDVVLNCLSGELLAEGWKCLAPHGRFIEIGRRDIILSGDLDLSGFANNCTYSAIDLSDYFEHHNPASQRVMQELMHDVGIMFANGSLPPIAPITEFSISEIESAFRLMAGGTHMGKIMICVKPDAVVKISERALPVTFDTYATYLLIGGLGGIGRSLAIWMAEQGAKHLTFFSRSGIFAKEQEGVQRTLQDLESLSCQYNIIQCDVGADASIVEEAILEAARERPIRGIVHTAMALKDGVLETMSHEDFMIPLHSKVNGLLNLQSAFENHPTVTPLDFFVILSSGSGIIGTPGQANYAAAGTFQDAFVHFRQMKGQPASVLDLGIVTKVGYVHAAKESNPSLGERLKGRGFAELSPTFLHKVFEMAIGAPVRGQSLRFTGSKFEQDQAQFILMLDISNCNPTDATVMPLLMDRKWASIKCAALEIAGSASNGMGGLSDLMKFENPFKGDVESRPAEEVIAAVTHLIIQKTSQMTMVPIEDIKPTHSLQRYGMDSLVAVELKNWLFKAVMVELSVSDIMEATSLRALGEKAYRAYMANKEPKEQEKEKEKE